MGLMKQGAMMTVLSGLVTALAWPATLLAATNFIDSHWAVAIDRSNTNHTDCYSFHSFRALTVCIVQIKSSRKTTCRGTNKGFARKQACNLRIL